jgi:IS5 family transposase
MKRFKRHKDYGLWDQDIRLSKLSELGDPLEKLNKGVNFELFRDILESNISRLAKGPGGRPPYDYVLMFKILILQRYYNLSDDQVEYQINDRMSFMRFPDLTIADDVPDSKTVWLFREQITELSLEKKLFNLFLQELERLHFVVNEGKIIDASFVESPRQRNTREQNGQIKQGKVPEEFKENPRRLSQKDVDARWTKKNSESFFGYKNHVKEDAKSRLITRYMVTDACVHDSNATAPLLDGQDEGECFYADSAYTGESQAMIIARSRWTIRSAKGVIKTDP